MNKILRLVSPFSLIKSNRIVQNRKFSVNVSLQAPTVAVVLAGNGVYDGSEVHEASAILSSLSRAGADIQCYAPDENQMHVINHVQGSPNESESRNVLVESARISRGNIKSLVELTSQKADAVIFPGGFGAAKNLSDFAVNGPKMSVKPDVERVLNDFHGAKKPIGLCCIAPMLAAKVLGSKGVKLTLGKPEDAEGKWPYGGALEAAKALGADVVHKEVNEVMVDEANKVVTTPAFMYNGKFHEIHDGVANMVNSVIKMI